MDMDMGMDVRGMCTRSLSWKGGALDSCAIHPFLCQPPTLSPVAESPPRRQSGFVARSLPSDMAMVVVMVMVHTRVAPHLAMWVPLLVQL